MTNRPITTRDKFMQTDAERAMKAVWDAMSNEQQEDALTAAREARSAIQVRHAVTMAVNAVTAAKVALEDAELDTTQADLALQALSEVEAPTL